MALALADSLIEKQGLEESDLLNRFVQWRKHGKYSSTGKFFDIGKTTEQALQSWLTTGNPHSGLTDHQSAGNGSLMRLAPVSILFWNDRERLRDAAGRQSKTTHAAPEAVDACIGFAEILADAISGRDKVETLRPRPGPYAGAIGAILAGSWKGKERRSIRSSGYVAHSLEAFIWCVDGSRNFEEAVLLAANLGEDADTTAAITGQLAGALHGLSGIRPDWVDRLWWKDEIKQQAVALMNASLGKIS